MQRRHLAVLAVLVVGMLIAPAVLAGAPVDRATGGGQIVLSSDIGGAGDTIAFTARGNSTSASGEVQWIQRTSTNPTGRGTGEDSLKAHGRVACLLVSGNMAKISGSWVRGDFTGNFELNVVDNGEGLATDDTIVLQSEDDTSPTCDTETDDDDGQLALARGNAQVYDAP